MSYIDIHESLYAFHKTRLEKIECNTGNFFRNDTWGHQFISCPNQIVSPFMSKCPAIFAVDKGWLLFDIVYVKWKAVSNNKQNRESTKGYSRWKVEQRHGNFKESGLNNWSTSKSPLGDGTRCPEGLAFPAGMPHPL